MSQPTHSSSFSGLTWIDHQEALNLLYQEEVLNHKLIWACARNREIEAYRLPHNQGVVLWEPHHRQLMVSVLESCAYISSDLLGEAVLIEGPEKSIQGIVEAFPDLGYNPRTSLIYTLEAQDLKVDREFRRLRPDDHEAAGWLVHFNEETRGRTLTHTEALRMLYATYREFYILEHRQKCAAVAAVNRWTLHYQSVSFVYVPPESRGKGFGRRLMASLSAFILQEKRKKVILFADPDNDAANALYRSLGYQVHGNYTVLQQGS
ncbi:GNAT family N-acetyltransferase [Deinococcus cellulosilyticus]|nr:GNAT family N-acetyltransferase [Deinococcus cellulosilyticus]